MLRRYFFTGLAILLPAVVTIVVVVFLINLLTRPFQGFVEGILSYYGVLNQFLGIISKTLIIVTLLALTFIVGILAHIVVTRYLIRLGELLIQRIPIVNKIYKAAQDVMHTLFGEEIKKTFSQVVLVPFPHSGSYSIGMITNECLPEEADQEHEGLLSVFVPATPNPTMGFLLMFKRNQVILLDMKVEDALRAIISCGVVFQEKIHQEESAHAR